MRGDMVTVRDCEGKPLVRRVWEETAEAVYIRSEEEYQKALSGESALDPVGFPWSEAFEYSAEWVEKAVEGDWSGLRPKRQG